MRKDHYSVAMSLDGYVSGPKGESDWIVMDPDIDFGSLIGQFDTVLLGRKTYETARAMGGGAAMPGLKAYVFSTTLKAVGRGAILSSSPTETIASLKKSRGKDIWLFGGGTLFRSLLALALVDIVSVAVIPVLLGGGLPLLPPPATMTRLALVKSEVLKKTGTVSPEYALVR